jgi:hypothetical protein
MHINYVVSNVITPVRLILPQLYLLFWLITEYNTFFFFFCRQEQEGPHQEAFERVHALHEGDAAGRSGRVHAQGVGRHQSDPRQKGKQYNYL